MGRVVAIVVLGALVAESFSPGGRSRSSRLEAKTTEKSIDVAISYDAAARLEYDAWRERYGKGEFEAEKYKAFKANYEALTVANVKAAKERREKGLDSSGVVLELNEYADMTEEEFNAARGGPLNDAMQ